MNAEDVCSDVTGTAAGARRLCGTSWKTRRQNGAFVSGEDRRWWRLRGPRERGGRQRVTASHSHMYVKRGSTYSSDCDLPG